jgi:hypothetical protein
VAAMFVNESELNEQLYRGPSNVLVSDWLISKKIFSSETAWLNESKLGRKHHWKVLYKVAHLVPIR